MTREKGVFSSETDGGAMPKIGDMHKRFLFSAAMTASALCFLPASGIAASSPLDFGYRVTGSAEAKPLLVFNDGVDTFIQPQDPTEKSVLVNGAAPVRQGPYFVVRGLVAEITINQGKSALVRISYAKPPKAMEELPAAQPAKSAGGSRMGANDAVAGRVAQQAPTVTIGEQSKPTPKAACTPHRETRETAFVATFKPGTSMLSAGAQGEFKKFVGETSSISSVEVIAEGGGKATPQKRADSIKKLLVDAGIAGSIIAASVRNPSGIGSEIHIKRVTEIPCGAAVVRMPSKKLNATVVWDGDGVALAERVAQELKIRFAVRGTKHPVPARLAVTDVSFAEAMQRIGSALGDDVDLVLRSNELILDFKDTQ